MIDIQILLHLKVILGKCTSYISRQHFVVVQNMYKVYIYNFMLLGNLSDKSPVVVVYAVTAINENTKSIQSQCSNYGCYSCIFVGNLAGFSSIIITFIAPTFVLLNFTFASSISFFPTSCCICL